MIEIPLTKGRIALIDDEDYPRVSQIKWHVEYHSGSGTPRIRCVQTGAGGRSDTFLCTR